VIAAFAELGSELIGESLIVVGYENGTHVKFSSGVRLEAIVGPSCAVNHAPWGSNDILRTYPRR
jgi:hypothetical protein